jgi:beta-lactamase regulating signal transducer with metallopeptidase domain
VRRADRAFGLLVVLALCAGTILIALLATLIPRAELLIARGPEGATDVVAILLLALATLGIGLGLSSLALQLSATLRLIRSLLARRLALPRRMRDLARELGLEGRIDLVEDDRPFSFTYWFLRPRISVSTGLVDRLDGAELRAVLLHERYHVRQRDPLRLVIARYFAAGLYVVPVVDDLVARSVLQSEIEADREAVTAMRGVGPLARALYKLLPDADDVSLGLLVPVGQLSVTEARIERLIDGRDVPLGASPASVALSLGALAAAAVLAAVQDPAATLEHFPPLVSVTGLLVAPASLLFIAAITGVLQQARLVIHR